MNTRQTTDGQATYKYYYFTIDICSEKSLIPDKRVVKGKNTALKLLTLIVRGRCIRRNRKHEMESYGAPWRALLLYGTIMKMYGK
jgi:hypothetical protein